MLGMLFGLLCVGMLGIVLEIKWFGLMPCVLLYCGFTRLGDVRDTLIIYNTVKLQHPHVLVN